MKEEFEITLVGPLSQKDQADEWEITPIEEEKPGFFRRMGSGIYSGARNFPGQFISSMGGLSSFLETSAIRNPEAAFALSFAGEDPAKYIVDQTAEPGYKVPAINPVLGPSLTEFGKSLTKEPKFDRGSVEYYSNAVTSSVLQMAPWLAASIASGGSSVPALLGMSAASAGEYFNRLTEKGYTPEQAYLPALGYGAAEALGENVPLGIILNPTMKIFKKLFLASLTEQAQEQVTTLIQSGIEKGTIDPNMSWKDYVENVEDTAVITFFQTLLLTGGSHPFVHRRREGTAPAPLLAPSSEAAPGTPAEKVRQKYRKAGQRPGPIAPTETAEGPFDIEYLGEAFPEGKETPTKTMGEEKIVEPGTVGEAAKAPETGEVVEAPEFNIELLEEAYPEEKKEEIEELPKEEVSKGKETEPPPPAQPPTSLKPPESPPRGEGQGTLKEPWEMTREEYWREVETKTTTKMLPAPSHQMAVKKALAAGKPVPPEVLKDYPELAPPKAETDRGPVAGKIGEGPILREAFMTGGFNKGASLRFDLTPETINLLTEDKLKEELEKAYPGINISVNKKISPIRPRLHFEVMGVSKEGKNVSLPEDFLRKIGIDKVENRNIWLENFIYSEEAPLAQLVEGMPAADILSKPKIETDSAKIQEIRNSIAEGEMILSSGKSVTGRKMSADELAGVKRSVENSKRRIPSEPPKEEKRAEERSTTTLTIRPSTYRGENGFTVKGRVDGGDVDIFLKTKEQAEEYRTRVKSGEKSEDVLNDIWKIGKKKKEEKGPEAPQDEPLGTILSDEAGFINPHLLGAGYVADAIKKVVSELQKTRTYHHMNWLMGRNEPGIDVFLGKKEHGPQAFDFLRNMESILSQTKPGRTIYEAGRSFKDSTGGDYRRWREKAAQITKDLKKDELLAVMEILDTEEDITGDTNIETAAAGMRGLFRQFRDWMIANGKDVGYIQGYFPHVFSGKFWVKQDGEFAKKVETIGEALKIAKDVANRTGAAVTIMEDTFIPPDDATMLSNRSYWRLVQTLQAEIGQSYGVMDVTVEEINALLRGEKIAKPKPKQRFFGNLMPRLSNNPNFLKDMDKVFDLFFYGGTRKVYQDRFMKTVQKNLEEMPVQDTRLKKFIENVYVPNILAHPSNFEEAVARSISKVFPGEDGQDVRRGFHHVNSVQYVWDLGISGTSAIANATQFIQNGIPIIGERSGLVGYRKAVQSLWNNRDMDELERMRITQGVSSLTGERLLGKGTIRDLKEKLKFKEGFSGLGEVALTPFTAAEMVNRFAAYWGGKDYARKQLLKGASAGKLAEKVTTTLSSLADLGRQLDARMVDITLRRNASWWRKTNSMREQYARKFGFELNEKVNFRLGRENIPNFNQQSWVRVLMPYKGFFLNQLKYTVETISPKGLKNNPKKALRFVALAFLLGGIGANPLLYGIYALLAGIYRWLFDKDLTRDIARLLNLPYRLISGKDFDLEALKQFVTRGASSLAGFDISGSVAIQLPKEPGDLFGRIGKLAWELGKLTEEKLTGKGTVYTERKLTRLALPAIGQRAQDTMRILEEGNYITPIKQTPIALKEKPWTAAVKRMAGFMPTEVTRTFDREKLIEEKKAKYKSISQDMTERLATAIKNNDQTEISYLAMKYAKAVNAAAERLVQAEKDKNEFAKMEAVTDLLFWQSWINQDEKFKNAIEKKMVPRQIEKPMGLPKYLRPEAFSIQPTQ